MSADGSYCLRYRIDEGKDFEASFSVLMQWEWVQDNIDSCIRYMIYWC